MKKLSPYQTGVIFAVIATIIWSFNFIIARKVAGVIPPVSLAFWRWAIAALVLLIMHMKSIVTYFSLLKKHFLFFFITAFFGVALFNTCIYIAGNYTPAINLSIIGTTTTPVVSVCLAAIFLNEKVSNLRIAGMVITVTGIIFLMSRGSWVTLRSFEFTPGDWWVIAGAISFAIYTIMVKKKPAEIPSRIFLTYAFTLGALLLLPAYYYETGARVTFNWNISNILIIAYLAIGTSVMAFLLWNAAIVRLGAATTALFGNLIPLFSIMEAVLILHEPFTVIHLISSVFIIVGLYLANKKR